MKFGLMDKDIQAIKKVFTAYPAIKKAILFGSRAMGNYRPGSDIDLTLEGEGLELTDLFEIENKLDDLFLPYKIDLSLKGHIANSELLEHINRVGEIIYKGDS